MCRFRISLCGIVNMWSFNPEIKTFNTCGLICQPVGGQRYNKVTVIFSPVGHKCEIYWQFKLKMNVYWSRLGNQSVWSPTKNIHMLYNRCQISNLQDKYSESHCLIQSLLLPYSIFRVLIQTVSNNPRFLGTEHLYLPCAGLNAFVQRCWIFKLLAWLNCNIAV